jgi:Flp pilus assembly protein TadD
MWFISALLERLRFSLRVMPGDDNTAEMTDAGGVQPTSGRGSAFSPEESPTTDTAGEPQRVRRPNNRARRMLKRALLAGGNPADEVEAATDDPKTATVPGSRDEGANAAVGGSCADSGPTEPGRQGRAHVGVCIICFENDVRPIQSGCACRGDAGLAHVECRVEAAVHRMSSSESRAGWWQCGMCEHDFTGGMQLGLAEAWWSRVQRLPAKDETRLSAAENLALALSSQGNYVAAEAMHRETLAVQRRVLGPKSLTSLATATNLAIALDLQGKHAQAETTFRDVLEGRRLVLGPHHQDTLSTANSLGIALQSQGKHAQAETIYREARAFQRRVLGPEHPDTLKTANNLALALSAQCKHGEAETMHGEVLTAKRRVLGPEHPSTLTTMGNLAESLDKQCRHAEAEKIFQDVLAIMRRVVGPEHPDTLSTAARLAACVSSSRAVT